MIKTNKKVIVGLSGGVDSSVTVCMLRDQGYDPIGVTMEIYRGAPLPAAKANSCFGHEKTDIPEIKNLCEKLKIPFYCFDCSAEFTREIISYFKSEYLAGRTPNPCIKCNELIKFTLLPKKAREAGIDFTYFATGHYAQIAKINNRYYLKQAVDISKDQSYFLYRLSSDTLSRTLFPLGAMTKDETRKIAMNYNLGDIATKKDSQDFYAGPYSDILDIPDKPGEFIDENGKVLGTHNGYWHYTLGQRRGMGIAHPNPLYVCKINPQENQVVVSTEKQSKCNYIVITDYFLNPISDTTIYAKIRSTGILQHIKNIEKLADDRAKVFFADTAPLATPGQSMVFYQNSFVIGGGIITTQKEIGK